MITKEAYFVGVLHSEPSACVNDWHIKGMLYLNYNDDGLGLLPIRRIK